MRLVIWGKTFKAAHVRHQTGYYSVAKYCSEMLVSYYHQHFDTIVLRFFAPYGMGQNKGLIPNLIERVK